jgi:hypothetical protein
VVIRVPAIAHTNNIKNTINIEPKNIYRVQVSMVIIRSLPNTIMDINHVLPISTASVTITKEVTTRDIKMVTMQAIAVRVAVWESR